MGPPRKDSIPQEEKKLLYEFSFFLEFKVDGWSCSSHFVHIRHKLEDEKPIC